MSAIALRDVVVRLGKTTVLDRIRLEIEPGELFLLLGPSGCGKTTVLRTIAGFAVRDAGTVAIDGRDVTRAEARLRDTAMVFQSYALWPHMNVGENIAFGLRERGCPRGEIESRVKDALDLVRLKKPVDHPVGRLSGGEQQRVALARALVVRPKCLLLDEPLSNLDATLRDQLREEIRGICRSLKLTTVYVTHDQKEALAVADRIAIMQNGHVLQVGPPVDVYRRPLSHAVAAFMGASNLLEGTVTARTAEECRIATPIGELVATGAGEHTVGSKVTVSLRPECLVFLDPASKASAMNVIEGELDTSRTLFLGDSFEHRVTSNGQLLRVREFNPSRTLRPRGAVTVTVAPADVHVMAMDRRA